MKHLFKINIIIFLFLSASCQAQKIMKTISDAKKLEINKDRFIGQPLKNLLAQIGPKIQSAIGDPDNESKERTKIISLFFIDKNDVLNRNRKGENPTSISVILEPAKEKKLPLVGSDPWTQKQVNEYGDMIILRLWVTGEN